MHQIITVNPREIRARFVQCVTKKLVSPSRIQLLTQQSILAAPKTAKKTIVHGLFILTIVLFTLH